MSSEFVDQLRNASFPQRARAIYKIEDKEGNLVPFELNESQKIVYREVVRQRKNGRPVRLLILKGRQQGMSTLCQGLIFDECLFRWGTKAITVGHKLDATNDLFTKPETMYDNLPDGIGLRPEVKSRELGRRMRYDSPVRSYMRADSAHKSGEVGRSGTFQLAHLTEVPQWKDPDDTMQAVLSCIPDHNDTMVMIETTAKGTSDWFYRQWVKGISDMEKGVEPEFVPVFVPWYKEKRYKRSRRPGEPELTSSEQKLMEQHGITEEQMLWYRDKTSALGEKVSEEYPFTWREAFLSAGLPFIKRTSIGRMRKRARPALLQGTFEVKRDRKTGVSVAKFAERPQGPTHLFEKRDRAHRYSVGFDPATGRAADSSAIAVLCADTNRVVATHQSKMLPDRALKEAYLLAKYFNDAVIVPERTGIGQTLVDRLVDDLGYVNVYIDESPNAVKRKSGNRYGFDTVTGKRMSLLEDMAHMVHNNLIEVPCARLVRELQNLVFVDDKGKRVEADAGSHDDVAFAFALAIQGLDQLPPAPGTGFGRVPSGAANF